MEKHLLSKSTFIRSIQCLKSLYLHKNRGFLRDRLSPQQRAKFTRGTKVGLLAQDLFPGGIDCKPKSPSQYRKAVEKTTAKIAEGNTNVIYEAAVQYDRVLILLDVLVKDGNAWNACEVKSSLQISETYILDAALQYYVLVNSGIDINRFFLVHINPDYVRSEALEIETLFSFKDVTAQVKSKQDFIRGKIEDAKNALELKKSPPINIGTHCHLPYPCDFLGHCWKHIPKDSIFSLATFSAAEKFDLYKNGIIKIIEIPDQNLATQNQHMELACIKNSTDFIDHQKLTLFFKTIHTKHCFVGFLGNREAIPQWKGYKAYDIIPISLTILLPNQSDGKLWFNDGTCDADENFVQFMDNTISAYPTIITHDATKLKELLQRIAQRKSTLATKALEIRKKIVDLQEAFDCFYYFHPTLKGNYNLQHISKVLLNDEGTPKVSVFSSDTLAINQYKKNPALPETMNLLSTYTQNLGKLTINLFHFLQKKRNR